MAAGALLGAASQDQAVELLGRVPGAVASVKVACWLRDLYPPESGSSERAGRSGWGRCVRTGWPSGWWSRQLTASPELAGRCLTGLDERQALRAVTLLGRAAADQQEAAGVLLERVLPLLEQVVAGLPADLGLLTAISDAIPYPSAALAEADLAVTRRILQVLPAGEPGLRARWLSWLGVTLAQTGRPAEALPADPGGGGDPAGSWPPPTPTGTGPTWPPRCPTSASGSRSWAARPRPCRLTQEAVASAGSWPPPTPTGTGPTWPARCPTSASGSRRWAARPRRCR